MIGGGEAASIHLVNLLVDLRRVHAVPCSSNTICAGRRAQERVQLRTLVLQPGRTTLVCRR